MHTCKLHCTRAWCCIGIYTCKLAHPIRLAAQLSLRPPGYQSRCYRGLLRQQSVTPRRGWRCTGAHRADGQVGQGGDQAHPGGDDGEGHAARGGRRHPGPLLRHVAPAPGRQAPCQRCDASPLCLFDPWSAGSTCCLAAFALANRRWSCVIPHQSFPQPHPQSLFCDAMQQPL